MLTQNIRALRSLSSRSSRPPLQPRPSSSPATTRRPPSPHHQSSQASGTPPSGAKDLWAVKNLAKFLELCHRQVNRGVLYSQSVSVVKEAMVEILPAMRTLNPCFTKGGMTLKYRSLLSEYLKVRTLLRPGVEYDNETGEISAPEEIWEVFEARYPDLSWIRDKGFPCMNEMRHLWPFHSEMTIAETESYNYVSLRPEDDNGLSWATARREKRKRTDLEWNESLRPSSGVSDPSSAAPRPQKLKRVERKQRYDKFYPFSTL
ncbi:hypothetical protein CSUB01_08693 [Colletotrichum sublineola]|uniref:Myb/SANT-like domain-containing protein n=1 Tax=Colletotrichum sublineola TaxID=1173701 RepID=A0A066X7U8_COLSU|nr:hypothetical protein CSUB01_08693 [Colletotrichum sublineola]